MFIWGKTAGRIKAAQVICSLRQGNERQWHVSDLLALELKRWWKLKSIRGCNYGNDLMLACSCYYVKLCIQMNSDEDVLGRLLPGPWLQPGRWSSLTSRCSRASGGRKQRLPAEEVHRRTGAASVRTRRNTSVYQSSTLLVNQWVVWSIKWCENSRNGDSQRPSLNALFYLFTSVTFKFLSQRLKKPENMTLKKLRAENRMLVLTNLWLE